MWAGGSMSRFIEKLEEEVRQASTGGRKWVRDWLRVSPATNPLSGVDYRGYNLTLLSAYAAIRGQGSRWATFNQITQAGYTLNKGAKAALCGYFGYDQEKERRICRSFLLFNLDETSFPSVEILPTTFSICDTVIKLGEPAYCKLTDTIYMPPVENFETPKGYDKALAHELIHSTLRIRERLNLSYAEEEGVAEIGACLITGILGQTPEYLEGWKVKQLLDIYKLATEAVEYLSTGGKLIRRNYEIQ
jgi:antirestriction protein ArdC